MKKISIILSMLAIAVVGACGVFYATVHSKNMNDECADVALVLGIHNNSPEISYQIFSDYIVESCMNQGRVSAIESVSQGIIVNVKNNKIGEYSSETKKKIAKKNANQILEMIKKRNQPSADTEFDTLSTILYANRQLPNGGTMIIADSGLNTKGLLDFKHYLYSTDTPKEIVDILQKEQMIPDLNNITVIWFFIGDTTEPQKPLTQKQRQRLKDIYSEIFIRSGAKEYIFMEDIPSDKSYDNMAYVTPIEIVSNDLTVIEPMESIVLDEYKLKFKGDTANFVSEDEAYSVLLETAEYMKMYSDKQFIIVGTTAGKMNNDFTYSLSFERANIVKEILVKYGVDQDQIVLVKGIGSNNSLTIDDIGTEGVLDEEKAKHNRSVVIMDVNDEKAWEYLE